LGALQVGKQPDGPEEEQGDDEAVPDEQHHPGLDLAQGEQPDQQRADEQHDGEQADGDDDDAEEDGVDDAALAELVDAQAPAEPEERLEVLPVHGAFSSSQASFGVSSRSAPAFSRKRVSSVLPWRISSRDDCSTSCPWTMMPTCVQSFSTISRTCDVRNTVDPRPT